ncbi:NAD-dependent succinate-semialdehyde dehydrogenase [Herbiconiux sp. KACC 21604]|uniref:NAD-dependent succinate-semialdehyde dehydrogenase n=1 Tax=unclassified Herbiconiux TaxID=2618217 RepID=UPI00149119B1|nr:NAD-dependent succinate-semialdehyde dehydrogenase [Herbiconiux sp. SALV-R1]QJU55673.1 NAD-dependent succinate-semialdehyde dehydrogenase [Herbiconiux sp. SALV-R1]WPO86876.1 NAD-dependent succinate-semialdehyde dehydrogenase [Herbiconiux sp. KACC 21604]
MYAVTDPSTGQTLAEYPLLDDETLEAHITGGRAVQREWAGSTTPADRAALLRRVAELHRERRDELARIITREMGKPTDQALGEVDFSATIYEYYADQGPAMLTDETIELPAGSGAATIQQAPVGVLLGIMPWNYPYYQVARFAGPNLVAGNTILLKHAEQCPESSAAIERIFLDAGFPEGAYRNIYADHWQIAAVIAHPAVAGVSLTGSERAGAAVAEIAGRHLKKVVLELGGSDPFLVLSTDDLPATVDAAVSARFANAGQACNAAKRFIVIDELFDEFRDLFVAAVSKLNPADPRVPGTVLGPLSSVSAARTLENQVSQAEEQGATVIRGGASNGTFAAPVVLLDVPRDSEAYREELFGPAAMLFRAASEDDAVRIANDTPYGLGSYVYTRDAEQAERVARGLDVGMVFVNAVGAERADIPFGGVKRSGFGRELGRDGIREFVNRKLVRTLS